MSIKDPAAEAVDADPAFAAMADAIKARGAADVALVREMAKAYTREILALRTERDALRAQLLVEIERSAPRR